MTHTSCVSKCRASPLQGAQGKQEEGLVDPSTSRVALAAVDQTLGFPLFPERLLSPLWEASEVN